MSNLVVDGGSIMNGTITNIGNKSRRREQNNGTPIVVEAESLDQKVCTV
jgi:hypothetical protein